MTDSKRKSLQAYLEKQLDRLSGDVPEKHSGHPKQFKEYIQREIDRTRAALEKGVS
jgi:hypothetical protein